MNTMPAGVTVEDHYLAGTLPALRPRLWTFALRLAGNRHDALVLVRRARAQAFERPDRFPTGFPTPSALVSLVHSIWLDELGFVGDAQASGHSDSRTTPRMYRRGSERVKSL